MNRDELDAEVAALRDAGWSRPEPDAAGYYDAVPEGYYVVEDADGERLVPVPAAAAVPDRAAPTEPEELRAALLAIKALCDKADTDGPDTDHNLSPWLFTSEVRPFLALVGGGTWTTQCGWCGEQVDPDSHVCDGIVR